MVSRNEITGDALRSKATSKQYADNYDRIFRKKEKADGNQSQEASTETSQSKPQEKE